MTKKIRKQESGFKKRDKKRRVDLLTQSQKGALDKFVLKNPSQDQDANAHVTLDDNTNDDAFANIDDVNAHVTLDDATIVLDVNMDATVTLDDDPPLEANANVDATVTLDDDSAIDVNANVDINLDCANPIVSNIDPLDDINDNIDLGHANDIGFLFTSKKLCSMDDVRLKSSCSHIEDALKKHDQSDIDGNDLYVELKLLQEFLSKEEKQPIDILNYMRKVDCFPNAFIVYRILLTIPVTVASAERSFSKLKLLKTYMRSTMTQERLNGLALLAIESQLLEKIDYEELIEDFVSNNARRIMLFK